MDTGPRRDAGSAARQTDSGRWIVPFSGDTSLDPAALGGKCHQLAQMRRHGLPVPDGLALTAGLFAEFVDRAGLGAPLAALLRRAPEDAAAQAEELLGSARDVEPLEAAILSAYAALRRASDGGDPRVAVRSSALSEDTAEASGAGQQLTLLDVGGEAAVLRAVRACWASVFSVHAIAYRDARGVRDEGLPRMAVGIQRLVDARVAGVMFTIDPITRDPDRMLIEATYGLGESLVGGTVTPDRYHIERSSGRTLREAIADKHEEVVATGTGGHRRAVPPARRRQSCLAEPERQKLHHLAVQVEALFGPGQDLEWAIDWTGELHLLQARPVTGSGAARTEEAEEFAPPAVSPVAAALHRRWFQSASGSTAPGEVSPNRDTG